MRKICLVTGITGQDGAYLSKLLISQGYKVIGLVRSYNNINYRGLDYLGIKENVTLLECDLTDITQIIKILNDYEPIEIYNLAAQSSVSLSFKQPIGTFHFNTISVFNLLESIRIVNKNIKFYQASSSEMFGKVQNLPITIHTEFHPMSPYAISKAAAHWVCINYRESYDIFTCCGILFNHESYLRSDNFFVKKIINESIKIAHGNQDRLIVGNIDIKRDFGYAPKYVEAMYLMMQKEHPSDYLICSGYSISLRDMINYIFSKLSIDISKLEISKLLFRPSDIEDIYGENDHAKTNLGWVYDITPYEMLDMLVEEELKQFNIST